MANLSDICVVLENLSSEYQPYAPQGHFLRGACGKFFAGLDLGLSMNPLKAQLVADSSTVRRLLASLSIDRKAD
jgi:hypothetical protein